jgi:hypothetical protein
MGGKGEERAEEDEDGGGGQIRGRDLELDLKNEGMLWRETEKRGGKEDGEIGAVFVCDLPPAAAACVFCFVEWSVVLGAYGYG